jgi:hypothetical protein
LRKTCLAVSEIIVDGLECFWEKNQNYIIALINVGASYLTKISMIKHFSFDKKHYKLEGYFFQNRALIMRIH